MTLSSFSRACCSFAYLYRNVGVKPTLHSWDKSYLVMMRNPFPMLVDWIRSYSDEFLCMESYFMVMTAL